MSLLDGKRILVTGVLTDASIAFHVARLAQEEGAQVVLSSYGRVLRLTGRIAGRLPKPAEVIELDVTNPEHLAALPDNVRAAGWTGWTASCTRSASPPRPRSAATSSTPSGRTSPPRCTSPPSPTRRWRWRPSRCSRPRGASVVGLTFDATVAWPKYDWMGVAKAGLESCSRYLAKYLGPENVRSNLVAAGPIRTMAAKSIPGFDDFESRLERARAAGLGPERPGAGRPGLRRAALGLVPGNHGEIIHVDGGVHAMGG